MFVYFDNFWDDFCMQEVQFYFRDYIDILYMFYFDIDSFEDEG